jgi:hypothetical protein
VAREISVDVRDTVRSIREELASAAREFRGKEGGPGDRARSSKSAASDKPGEQRPGDGDEAQGAREEARRSREQMRADFRGHGRGRSDWAGWTAWSEWARGKDWTGGTDWSGNRDWTGGTDWSGNRDWTGGEERAGGRGGSGGPDSASSGPDSASSGPDSARSAGAAAGGGAAAGADSPAASGAAASGHSAPGDQGSSGRSDDAESSGQRSRRSGPNPFSDLERLAIQFATELRAAARQTGGLGERSLNDLRDILTDTLAKVRVEVFNTAESRDKAAESDASKPTASDDPGGSPASHPDDTAPGKTSRSS